jgi:NADH-quinone oxidoreductase subunit N
VLGEANHIGQWAGLAKRSPFLAAAFSIFLLSFAGIPGTAGFIAKFTAFSAGVGGDATPLVVVGVLASAISLFFYVRIIVLMYFVAPAEERETVVPTPNAADPAEDGDEASELEGAHVAARTSVVTLESNTGVGVVRSNGTTLAAIVVALVAVIGLGLFPSPVLSVLGDLFVMWG